MSVFIMKYFYDKLSRLIGGLIHNVRFPMLCRGENKSSSCLGYKINTLGSLMGRTGLHNEQASALEPRQMTLINTTSSSNLAWRCGNRQLSQHVGKYQRKRSHAEKSPCRSHHAHIMIRRKYVLSAENMPLSMIGFVKGRQ
jgi:hypothetical protein